jgi:hypothetical protein
MIQAAVLSLFIAAGAHAEYLPSPQRFEAASQSGHNAETDESAVGCRLDYVRMKGLDDRWNLLFYVWSDFRSRISFVGGIPGAALPLKEGARWQYNGNEYRYENGLVLKADGSFRLKIDSMLMGPSFFEGKDPARPEHRLSCEF